MPRSCTEGVQFPIKQSLSESANVSCSHAHATFERALSPSYTFMQCSTVTYHSHRDVSFI